MNTSGDVSERTCDICLMPCIKYRMTTQLTVCEECIAKVAPLEQENPECRLCGISILKEDDDLYEGMHKECYEIYHHEEVLEREADGRRKDEQCDW